jgi:transcriptional regulator with XRE-family HTH domain
MHMDRPTTRTLSRLDVSGLIREARHVAGLSQAELASRIGTTQPVISRWERGADVPRMDALARVLQACGFEADVLFRRHDDVDRAQIRGQLAMTPEQRLASSEAVSELVGLARAK